MKKSLANRLYLKKELYTLQMEESKELGNHLDDYNKIILNLNGGRRPGHHITLFMIYGKQTLTMNEVKSVLNSKELQRKEISNEPFGEGLNVRGRTEKRDNKKTRGKSRSKSRNLGMLLLFFHRRC